jgi:heterodisulfide reductase subunit C
VKTTRTIEISVETDEVFVIRRVGSPVLVGCAQCGEATSLVTPEEASRLTGLSCREISRRVEAGLVHFSETTDGLLFICINSLCE